MPHPQNNALLEFRELDKYKKKTAESVVRLWDLGFRPEEEEDDEDGDEEETKVWERSKRGHFDYALCGPDMLIATNADCIDWMDYSTGDILRHVPVDKICSKAVMTSDLKFVAVAHLSHCSVWEVSTGDREDPGQIQRREPPHSRAVHRERLDAGAARESGQVAGAVLVAPRL